MNGLKSRREALGLTLEQTGDGIGGKTVIHRLETGLRDPRRLRLATAKAYADHLRVSLDEFWTLCDDGR